MADLRGRAAEILASTLGTGEAVASDEEARCLALDLRAAMARLTDEERSFVRWHYEVGETVDEAAARLGVSRRTAFRLQDRVRARLVAALRSA